MKVTTATNKLFYTETAFFNENTLNKPHNNLIYKKMIKGNFM